jgi:hypothetical protein
MSEQMREEFEKWAAGVGLTLRGSSGNYLKEIQCAWMSWQASRAALVIELPLTNSCSNQSAYLLAVSDSREAIHAAGVKTK